MINEFSNLDAMKKVWDAVLRRSHERGEQQIVSMVCHTYTMGQTRFEEQLSSILDYVCSNGGQIVTPSHGKAVFDARALLENPD